MKFDHANRLFHSVEAQWHCATSSTQDVQELIPEFFYLPDFLKNKYAHSIPPTRNHIQLGILDSGADVDNVQLPAWVLTQTPEEFIFKMRQALESDHVSHHLPLWIDLIFGCKSRGQPAVKAKNLFYYLTYEEGFLTHQADDPHTLQGILDQISHFGQTPMQLFDKPHHRRADRYPHPHPSLRASTLFPNPVIPFTKAIPLLKFSKSIKKLFYATGVGLLLLLEDFQLVLIAITQKLSNHKLKKELTQKKEIKSIVIQKLNSSLDYLNTKFVLIDQKKKHTSLTLLAVAGHIDSSIKFFSLAELKLQFSLRFHRKETSCLFYCTQSKLLVVGSKDTRISIWKVNLLDESHMVHSHP